MKKRLLALLLTGTLFAQSGIALAAEIDVGDSAEIEEVAEEIVVSDSEDTEEAIEPVEAEEAADETQEVESEETVAEESVQAITVEDDDEESVPATASGKCGNNLTWYYGNGILKIDVTGPMYSFSHWDDQTECYVGEHPPWEAHYGDQITSVEFGSGVTTVGIGAFRACPNIKEVTVPANVKEIGAYAFRTDGSFCNEPHLEKITILNRNCKIGDEWNTAIEPGAMIIGYVGSTAQEYAMRFPQDYPFCNIETNEIMRQSGSGEYEGIHWILQDGTLTLSGTGAISENWADFFVYRNQIQNVVINEGITSMGESCWWRCEYVESIICPISLRQIGKFAFQGCRRLTNIQVNANNPYFTSVDGVLYNKSGTEIIAYPEGKPQYEVPETVEEIPDNAFSYNLNDLTVGTGVTRVGNQIFDSAASTSTSSVSTQSAIKIASASKKVTFKGNAPKFKPNAFKGKTVIAYYPASNSTWTSSVRKNYGGTVTWIATGKIPASSCSMTLSKTIFTYNGKVQKPTVTIKDPNGKTISSGNYKVTYSSGCKNLGEYKVTVKFNGSKYTGSMSKTFTIGPKSTSLKSLTTGTKCFTVKWTKQPTLTSGYQLRYATNSKFTGAKTVTIASIKTTSKKITGLKDATKYYVQIRTYKTVSGKKYYSNWSSAKTVTTKAPVPKATSLTSVTAASKGFTAKWSKQTTQTTGYQLQYSTSSKFTGAKTVWITSNKTTSKKISGLTAKKKYYVRIRTYKTLNGKKYYSSWSKTKTVTTKK